jgi:hypothetical protein
MTKKYFNVIIFRNNAFSENKLYTGPKARFNAETFFVETILGWNDSFSSEALDNLINEGYYQSHDDAVYLSEPELK